AGWEADIARFIQQNHLQHPVIVGHSLGGGLAMALAADYPDLVGKIVVVDALPCLAALLNPSFASKADNNCAPMAARMAAISDEEFANMQRATITSMMVDTVHRKEVAGWSLRSDRTTMGLIYCDFSNTDLRPRLGNIKCPALVLLEPQFTSMKPKINEQFGNLANADIRYASKGLHFIMYDDRDWYYHQLDDFLK
ncbi:MAG: alpha/beta hydrolase, partial [Chitinophagia bacterium]|nr:alpha/beta hydrolase [Chitinophagia bacterium]